MASAQISVGNVTVAFEDEDRSAKSLSRLAVATLSTVVSELVPDEEEEVDG